MRVEVETTGWDVVAGVLRVRSDGSEAEYLTISSRVADYSNWSPDRTRVADRLAFVGKRGNDLGLWTLRSDGSDLTFRLYTIAGGPAWGR